MKKIINGKAYNTETAKELGSYWNGYPHGDFSYVCETLYVKRTGEYFLHCEGGPFSEYVEYVGRERCFGSYIYPYSETEAKEWAEKKLSAEEFEKIFDEVEE